MTSKLTKFFAATVVVGGLATGTTVFAEGAASPSQSPRTEGPMGGHNGMMNMQMSSDQVNQMYRMVENCNRMMAMMEPATAPASPGGAASDPDRTHG